MISIETFLRALEEAIRRKPNDGQGKAIEAAKAASLFIVAGPGTGKTATLSMRMLKLIFVDGVSPRGILATTFTKKAAQELRSRLLSWGYAVQEHLLGKEKLSKMDRLWLDRVDINQVRTGTIDSVCGKLLCDICRQGRKFGIGLTVKSQQVTEIDHGVLTQLNTELTMSLGNDGERREAIRNASADLFGFERELQVMGRGQSIVSASYKDIPIPIQTPNFDDGEQSQ
jgi:hypothetical protein